MDPSIFEMASLMGFDTISTDMEHHFYSVETAGAMMRERGPVDVPVDRFARASGDDPLKLRAEIEMKLN